MKASPKHTPQGGLYSDGNFFKPTRVFPKLTVNAPNDKYEQEADAMADKVMRMKDSGNDLVQPKPLANNIQRMDHAGEEEELQTSSIQRACSQCEEEAQRKPIMRQAAGGGFSAPAGLSSQLQSRRGGGSRLPEQTQSKMSSAFGTDFSDVRIHTGSQAENMSQSIQAKAFTHGSDIYFNKGAYQPGSQGGDRLLAHELTHVVQQGGVALKRQDRGGKPIKNNSSGFAQITAIELVTLYISNSTSHSFTSTDNKNYQYDETWLRSSGKLRLKAAIINKISGLHEKDRININQHLVGMKNVNSVHKLWVRDLLFKDLQISYDQRSNLIDDTKHRLTNAFTAFSTATKSVQDEIKAKIKARQEMIALFLDVFMVFGAPAFAKGISALANRLPTNATNFEYRIALSALDESRTKNIFSSATKIVKSNIKRSGQALVGETKIDVFLRGLRDGFAINTQDLKENKLTRMTAQEIGVVAMAYDADTVREADYINQIKRRIKIFETQIEPIGKKTDGAYGTKKARWIEGKYWSRLALTGEGRYYHAGFSPRFITWISPAVKKEAIKLTKAINFGRVENIHYTNLRNQNNVGVSFLDSERKPDADYVMKRATGIPPRRSITCPSCHGESVRPNSLQFSQGDNLENHKLGNKSNYSHQLTPTDMEAIRKFLQSIPSRKE